MRYKTFLSIIGVLLAGSVQAGPYPPAAGQSGSTAVSKNSPDIVGWATGYLNYLPGPNVDETFKTPNLALGPASGVSTDVVSLGDNGRITLTFGGSIFNGPGADFAVFENSFSDMFLELAWVEVSSDGSHFFRFPGFSLTANGGGSFGLLDPTNLDGFAGKYRGGFGTPFDLDLLRTVPGLNVNAVRYVRIVDIVGDGTVFDNFPPPDPIICPHCDGPHPIFDPFPTVGSGGFDLDGVSVMHLAAVPEPSNLALYSAGAVLLLLARRRTRHRRPDASGGSAHSSQRG